MNIGLITLQIVYEEVKYCILLETETWEEVCNLIIVELADENQFF